MDWIGFIRQDLVGCWIVFSIPVGLAVEHDLFDSKTKSRRIFLITYTVELPLPRHVTQHTRPNIYAHLFSISTLSMVMLAVNMLRNVTSSYLLRYVLHSPYTHSQ